MNMMLGYQAGGTTVFQAAQNPRATRDLVDLVHYLIETNTGGVARWFLWWPDYAEILRRNPILSVKTWRGTTVAGCIVDRTARGTRSIQSLIKVPYAGHSEPREVVDNAIVGIAAAAEAAGEPPPVWEADIRIMPQGWCDQGGNPRAVNTASRRIFKERGFEALLPENVYEYQGNTRDRHLIGSLEPDQRTYRNLTMRSTPRTLQLARDFLAALRNR